MTGLKQELNYIIKQTVDMMKYQFGRTINTLISRVEG